MDPIKNPFVPGAGSPPPELAGRDSLLEQARIAIARVKRGTPAKSLILVGLRGVGKTVLLVRIKEQAERDGIKALLTEAHEGKSLAALLIPQLRSILYSLDIIANAKEKVSRGLRVLRSFIGSIKVTHNEIEYELGVDPEVGVADSGDFEADLSALFVAVGEAAKAADTAVALLIDELQYLNEKEFGALIMAVHKINQERLPFLLVAAGLPQILGLAGNSKSYAERLFDFPRVDALPPEAATSALAEPVAPFGVSFSPDALTRMLEVTERYPYFLQQWGYEAWNVSAGPEIGAPDVELATGKALRVLDESFFRVRFDRCTPSEKRYLRALAELGQGPQKSGAISEVLGVKVSTVAPIRAKLIQKGMIYSQQHGDTAFTVPMFDAYMRRVMPGNDWKSA
ncbi:AAA family ATPase [Pleomorphomonas sp. NRK KF1]|uniref:AAA family ATPase n=1 Tax=Pleomorphomonas sp. NRK KF1 TaxID=2943000 RepID=UPI0020438F27|nr:AAA family ATPase [Pleomorphomonas sp. NRK KF1]